ncbi:MAG: PEP-CTERM sorting domain-containing protein [Planctomycetota bacterium]
MIRTTKTNRIAIAATTGFAMTALAGAAQAQLGLTVSDNIDNQLPGLTFTDGDIVETNQAGSFGSEIFDEGLFGGTNVDVDAFHWLGDGTYLLSTIFNNRNLGGGTFSDGDLIRYDPATDTASVFEISEAAIGDDIDAASVLADGNIVFSTGNFTNTIGGVAVTEGDILLWNSPTDTVSVLHGQAEIFDDGSAELSAIHAFGDGTYLISAFGDEMISGTMFENGDLVLWDSNDDSASLFFDEDNFLGSNGYNINGASIIPAPASLAVLGLGGFAATRRRR